MGTTRDPTKPYASPFSSHRGRDVLTWTQWTFENAGGNQTFNLKSAGSNQYLAAAGDPGDGQKVIAGGQPYAWHVEDQQGVDNGVRCVVRFPFWGTGC